MKVTLLSLALLGSPSAFAASDRLPQLDVDALCKATSAVDKAAGLAEAQGASDCMRDEMAAKQQLVAVWSTSAGPVRDRCEGEAIAGDSQSYVDLLTCMQMENLVHPAPSAAPLRGTSKKRYAK